MSDIIISIVSLMGTSWNLLDSAKIFYDFSIVDITLTFYWLTITIDFVWETLERDTAEDGWHRG